MDRLELVRRLADETGTEERDAITSTTSPDTNHIRKLVLWIDRAYREIQIENSRWKFRLGTKDDFALSADTREYDITAQVSDFEEIQPYTRVHFGKYLILDDEPFQPVRFFRWDEFRGYNETRTGAGRPRFATIDRDNNLIVYPTPREAHTLKFAYTKAPDVMAADGDEPILPERFHELLVYHALLNYAVSDEAGNQASRAAGQYRALRHYMRNAEIPDAVVQTPDQ